MMPSWSRFSSSDSDWSDSDLVTNGLPITALKLNSLHEKIRFSAVTCLHTAVKVVII